jgi:hypothetical protein
MATTMLIHPWLKFTVMLLFNAVICTVTSKVYVSVQKHQVSVPYIDVCSVRQGDILCLY